MQLGVTNAPLTLLLVNDVFRPIYEALYFLEYTLIYS